jgi:NMT1-like family
MAAMGGFARPKLTPDCGYVMIPTLSTMVYTRPPASRGGSDVKRMSWFSLTLLLLFAWTGISLAADPKADNKMGIITGGEKGTYYQFGLDLQKLMRLSEITLNVFNSKGSIENVFAVYQRPGVQLGIVQSDVLAFISRLQTDQNLIKIAKKTRMVFPLYNEEIHVLGRRGLAAPSSPPACSCSCPM